MAGELEALLARGPELRWFIGKVSAVTGDTVSLTYSGGTMTKVGCLDQYIPVVNDIVHGLIWEPNGALVLGSNNTPGSPPTPPTPGPQVTVSANATGSYDTPSASWVSLVGNASPTLYRAWFYTTSAFSALAGLHLQAFEIEITQTFGNGIEFATATNTTPTGPFMPIDHFTAPATAYGVPTWVPLPIDWGQRIVAGSIHSIAVGGGQYPASLTGTGRLRLTAI